jgi:hypothetical protein
VGAHGADTIGAKGFRGRLPGINFIKTFMGMHKQYLPVYLFFIIAQFCEKRKRFSEEWGLFRKNRL